MLKNIDVEKTIALNEIQFITDSKSADKIGSYVVFIAGFFLPMSLAIIYAINYFHPIIDDFSAPIYFIVILMFISLFMLQRLFGRKKIKRFFNIDKELIMTAIKVLNWTIVSSDERYLVVKPGTSRRQVSIIFDKNDVLVHSLMFGQFNFYDKETRSLNILMDVINKIKERS